MIVSITQVIILCTLISFTVQRSPSKRSPLELGLVSFDAVQQHPQYKIIARSHHGLKATKAENTEDHHVLLHQHTHVKHEWIPGHVHNHAFIPAHSHNVFIPSSSSSSIVLTKSTVHSIIVPYRNYYGGYGIGINTGGPGAGHGFHVLY